MKKYGLFHDEDDEYDGFGTFKYNPVNKLLSKEDDGFDRPKYEPIYQKEDWKTNEVRLTGKHPDFGGLDDICKKGELTEYPIYSSAMGGVVAHYYSAPVIPADPAPKLKETVVNSSTGAKVTYYG